MKKGEEKMIFFQSIQSVLSIIIMIALGYILKGQGWFDVALEKVFHH